MGDLINQVITAAIGVAILGGAYLLDLFVGVIKVLFTDGLKWSWAKMGKDLLKALLWGIAVVGTVAMLNLAAWFGTLVGANLDWLGDASFPVMIAGILGGIAWYLSGAVKNVIAFIGNKTTVTVDTEQLEKGAKIIGEVVQDWWKQAFTTKEAAASHKQFEEDGGQGAAYFVPIDSYDNFRNAVIGKSYDIDGYYGAQCWDGAALLWQQIGRSLSTGGTGAAKGCWSVQSARTANAGDNFDLITNFADLQRGDVVVFGYGTYGHIAFVDSVSPFRILGQNQTGTGNGAPFNVIGATSNGFLGAFRFRRWAGSTPAPAPSPTPSPAPAPQPTPTVPNNPTSGDDIKVGDSVIVNGSGTADSYGGGAQTRNFSDTTMKVLGVNNGRYALNQYNQGTIGKVADITGWFSKEQVRKA
jgi:hypothetical protein